MRDKISQNINDGLCGKRESLTVAFWKLGTRAMQSREPWYIGYVNTEMGYINTGPEGPQRVKG